MKKVLILTYYWPPSGGPGVQRILHFCKYLPQFGWEPIVLTVAEGEYPERDETLLQQISPSLKVVKTKSLEPFGLYRQVLGKSKEEKITTFVLTESSKGSLLKRLSAFIRANIFIPDARIGWYPFAVKKGLDIIKKEKIDLLFSTSPPNSVNVIAQKLAEKSKIKWVADYRDPWTDVFYYHQLKRTKWASALDRKKEQQALQKARSVITVSPEIVRLFQSKASNNYFVIPNGFDEDDFKRDYSLLNNGVFRIVHTGHLAGNQNPVGLWQALADLVNNTTFSKSLQLLFCGRVHEDIYKSLKHYKLDKYCTFQNYKPHDKIVDILKSASLLYFVIPTCSYSKGILTSKLFDYLGATRPILGIGPADGDAAAILKETQAGEMFDNKNSESIRHYILKLFEKKHVYQGNNTVIQKYTRKNQTKQLADIFNTLVQ